MANYVYRAKSATGKDVKGRLEAESQNIVFERLRAKGLYPVSVTEETFLQKDISFGKKKITKKDLAVFMRQFSILIKTGVSVLESLKLLGQQTENSSLKKIIMEIYSSVQKGLSLYDSIKDYKEFPSIMKNLIQAGEYSGNIEEVLLRLADHFEKDEKVRNKVKSATTYPAIVSVVGIAVVIFLVVFIVPTFVNLFGELGQELPVTTRTLLAISNFFKTKYYIYIPFLILMYFVFKATYKSENGRRKIDMLLLKLPGIGNLNTKIYTSRIARNLAMMLSSGTPLIQAIKVVEDIAGNMIVKEGLIKARAEVSNGKPLNEPFDDLGIFPPMVIFMIKIGEETGTMEEVLEKVSDFYDEEVDVSIGQLTTMIEPVILVALAVVVGFIILSILQPMFEMYSAVGI